jgi:hypothetical protein
MSRRRKIGVSVLMGLGVMLALSKVGFVTLLLSLHRAMAFTVIKLTKLSVLKLPDVTWEFSNLLIWTW